MVDEISATLEHRLTLLEGTINAGFELQAHETRTLAIEVSGMKLQVKEQNGRIGLLESWRQFVTGLKEGRSEIGKGQLAFLAVGGPMVFASLDFALRTWG